MYLDTAAEAFIHYKVLRRGSTNTTKITYCSILKDFINGVPISTVEELTLDIIDCYIDLIGQRNYKPKTFKNKIVVIRSFVRYLYSKNLTNIRPESIELPKVQDLEANFLDYDEQQKLYTACVNARERAIVCTLISSGMRVSELAEMRCDDLFERSIVVRCGKGKKSRVTFITEDCEQAIIAYLQTKRRRSTYMFTGLSGDKLSRQFINRIIKDVAARTDIDKKVSPHTLRHSFATNLLRKGARIEDVQPMMGHANISTTRAYMHFTNDYLHERYNEFMEI